MIHILTNLVISDNSGGIRGYCIRLLKPSMRIGATAGDVVKIVVSKTLSRVSVKKIKRVEKSKIYDALCVRVVKSYKRWGNIFISSRHNACIIINNYKLPMATRLFGPIFRDIRSNSSFLKVIYLSEVSL